MVINRTPTFPATMATNRVKKAEAVRASVKGAKVTQEVGMPSHPLSQRTVN